MALAWRKVYEYELEEESVRLLKSIIAMRGSDEEEDNDGALLLLLLLVAL